MGFQKFGTGEILPTDEQEELTKTAAQKQGDWTAEDEQELARENDQS